MPDNAGRIAGTDTDPMTITELNQQEIKEWMDRTQLGLVFIATKPKEADAVGTCIHAAHGREHSFIAIQATDGKIEGLLLSDAPKEERCDAYQWMLANLERDRGAKIIRADGRPTTPQ